jgi:hypothetical protein
MRWMSPVRRSRHGADLRGTPSASIAFFSVAARAQAYWNA